MPKKSTKPKITPGLSTPGNVELDNTKPETVHYSNPMDYMDAYEKIDYLDRLAKEGQ